MIRSIFLVCILFFIQTAYSSEQLIIEPEMGREPILSTLANAKNTINVVMYGFTDQEVMRALVQAKKSGKDVHVMLEKAPYRFENENSLAKEVLEHGNVPLKWASPDYKLTHQKTIITDHKNALIMTFNLTHSSFLKERNFALIIDDPTLINEIETQFSADWIHKKSTTKNSHLVWSPDNSRAKVLDFIKQAKSSIQIYAQDVSDYEAIGALAMAARRGVHVDILTSTVPSPKNHGKYNFLTRAGVNLHFSSQYYIHAKVIIIDGHYAMLGSMNLTKSSIDKNRELSIVTDNKDVIKKLQTVFAHDCGKKATLDSKIRWWLQTSNKLYRQLAHLRKEFLALN